MPASLFTEDEYALRTRYPAQITPEECLTFFTLTSTDQGHLARLRGDANRLGYSLQLASIRYLGFVPDDLLAVPAPALAFLAQQVGTDPALLAQYGQRPQTRTDHLGAILHVIGWTFPTKKDLKTLGQWLQDRALEHDSPVVLFDLLAEKLRSAHMVRPGFTVLERLIGMAREAVHATIARRLKKLFTKSLRAQLDALLVVDPVLKLTRLAWLRQRAVDNTPEEITTTLEKIQFLRRLGVDAWDLAPIPPNRRKWLTELCKHSRNQALQRMAEPRRYPALVAFLRGMLEEHTDIVIGLVDVCLHATESLAKRDVEQFHKRHVKAANEQGHYFALMGKVILNEAIPNSEVRPTILARIPRDDLELAVREHETIKRPLDDNALDFFHERYAYLRQFSARYLDTLRLHGHPEATPVLTAVALIRKDKPRLPNDAPLTFVSTTWRPYVVPTPGTIERSYYEMATLLALQEGIKTGNIWVEHSRQFAEPNTYLMPTKRWQQQRQDICALLQTSASGRQQLQVRQADLESLMSRLNDAIPTSHVRIENEAWVISPLRAVTPSARIKRSRAWLSAAMPWVEIGDLLSEVDAELHFTEALTLASGGTAHLPEAELKPYLYAAIVAQACNYGITRLAQMANLSYETLHWVSDWYLRADTLQAANALIVNAHHRLPFSQHWGTGTLSSSDGQRFPVVGKARDARAINKYFVKKGQTSYTWTSDQLSQYGTKMTITTARDAPYVLDAILDNLTELLIQEHTADTSGYTEILFCFFDLLGLRYSPRIKNMAAQLIYRMDRHQQFAAIDPLIKGTINTKLILAHYDELLHIVASLKYGHVSASLLIQKLQANVKQNALARAAQEYGRLCKSIFILRMLYSVEDRRYVHVQLNKGENVHTLRQFLVAANQGMLALHQPEEFLNQALCLTVTTNAVIYWNTRYLDLATTSLRAQGFDIQEEDLRHIYPTQFAHINPHGTMTFPQYDGHAPPLQRALRLVPLPGSPPMASVAQEEGEAFAV